MAKQTYKVIITADSNDMLPTAETLQDFLNEVSVDGETYKVEDYKEEASG